MKFFAFIMAVIVLSQSWMPCKDDAMAMSAGKTTTETILTSSQQDHKDHADACSPFCQCSCCSGFSINHTFASMSTPLIPGNREFFAYLHANLIKISLPIWQPPQLAA